MDKIIKPARLAVITVLLVLLFTVTMVSLYRVQIVDGAAHAEQAKNSIVNNSVVPAARGNILDRYGRVLVSNRTCNNLIFNTEELFEQEDPNAIILELAQTVVDCGNTYIDTLPITKEAPFEYIANMTDIQSKCLEGYLEANKLPASTTAVELMAAFRQNFKIDPNYTSEETRIIAGIRYEIKVRYLDTVRTSDYIFAEDVSIDTITRLMENEIPGFLVASSFVREYNTKAASHILGYIGMMTGEEYNVLKDEGYPLNAVVGKDGIEKAFESYLHGVDGQATIISTKSGTVLSTDYTKEVVPGNNVTTTLDISLQEAAEAALGNFITKTNAERVVNNAKYEGLAGYEDELKALITGGAVVAIKVDTGEPLCIASYPGFDVATMLENYDELLEDPNAPLFNRALNGTYAPGSTFKPVTAIAALASGKVAVNTTIYDKGKFTDYEDEGYAPVCWIYKNGVGSHGDVNVTKAIEVSCNYYFYTVGRDTGIDVLSSYAKCFGLGESTGIELVESSGIMPTEQYKVDKYGIDWYIGDTLQTAIGQGDCLFTPLQLANFSATLANDGVRYEASILKSVRTYDYSETVYNRSPKVADEIDASQDYFDAVNLGMYNVANTAGGTAYSYFGNFVAKVAAKTGTAQLGEGQTNNGVFICYAPYDDPEIAVAVVVEKGGAGSAVAGVAKDVLEYYFSFRNSSSALEAENALLK